MKIIGLECLSVFRRLFYVIFFGLIVMFLTTKFLPTITVYDVRFQLICFTVLIVFSAAIVIA